MFEQIKEYFFHITKDKNNIKVEDIVIYENKKIAIAIDCIKYMASFEILADYTYDFLVVDVDSEKIITAKTKILQNIEDLYKEINNDFKTLNSL